MSVRARPGFNGAGPVPDQPDGWRTEGGAMEQGTVKLVTYEEAKAALLEIADGNPGWVDPHSDPECHDGCRYAVEGNPSCIVGHVIYLLTPLDADRVMRAIGTDEIGDCSPTIGSAMEQGGLRLDEKARVLLGDVQQEQDTGVPWKKAVDKVLKDIEG